MVDQIAVIGSCGAIGGALARQLAVTCPGAIVHAFSSREAGTGHTNIIQHAIDYESEASIEYAASVAAKEAPLDMVIVTTGMLHDGEIMPEKSLQQLSTEKFQRLFRANTILPALIAKYFIPKLNKNNRSVFAALSARVGSISDNRLGGWYAYRASKAALNMVIKNAAIEVARRNKRAVIVGLHPGTVDSPLSWPFQANVPAGKLFTADFSAKKLLDVLNRLTPDSSGKCLAWDGEEIKP